MFCGKCGAQIKDGTKFCPNCGEQIEQTDSKKITEKSEKGKKKKTGILIVIALVIMIALAVCLILGIKEKPVEDGKLSEININSEDEQQTEMSLNSEDGQQTEVNIDFEDEQQTETNQEHKKAVLKSEDCRYPDGTRFYRREYDSYGNETFYEGEYRDSVSENQYSEKGLLTTTIRTYTDGDKYIYSYEYNEYDKLVLCVEEWYSSTGVVKKNETTYVYDESGNIVGKNTVYNDSNGNSASYIEGWEWEWNEKSEKWRETYYYLDSENIHEESFYDYSENGDVISVKDYDDGKLNSSCIHEYVYNDEGNIIEEIYTWYDSDTLDEKDIWSYSYEYDTNGNLSVEYSYVDGELGYVTNYTYYE